MKLARKVLGDIELDPASCFEANEAIVKAHRFYSEEDDALIQSWASRSLFINPLGAAPNDKRLPRYGHENSSKNLRRGCPAGNRADKL